MKLKFQFLLLSYFILNTLNAQLSNETVQKIDNLFAPWATENHPGGTVGIMKNGKIIYSKAFGLASLEYEVPNTTETKFNIASVSKQFTAMGIVKLHEKGLLSIDDDIRKYLPNMPDFGHTITIRHMLHHTSGMRSSNALLNLAGWRRQDPITNDDVYRFMLKQRELNFIPGDKYLYCNTGYILMAKIIENVTKQEFSQWMTSNIFEPLELVNTYVEDKYDRVIKKNATSYHGIDVFYKPQRSKYYTGSGNLRSTTTDVLHWLQNFSTPAPNWETSFEMLKTTDTLNDGSKNSYAFGVGISNFKNHTKISHNGGGSGWQSTASHYPEEQLSIVILSNFSSSKVKMIEPKIANILLKNKFKTTKKSVKPKIPLGKVIFSPEQLVGKYKTLSGRFVHVSIKNGALHVFQEWDNFEYNIYKTKGNIYESPKKLNKQFVFSKLKNNTAQLFSEYFNGRKSDAKRDNVKNVSNINLNDYTGKFYSPELESTIDIILKKQHLTAHHARHGSFLIKLINTEHFKIVDFGSVDIVRNSNSIITGIRISNTRALNVWFEKQ